MASPRRYLDNTVRTKSIEDVKHAQVMQVKCKERWEDSKPLSILALDPADRAVLKIAGENRQNLTFSAPCSTCLVLHVVHYYTLLLLLSTYTLLLEMANVNNKLC